MYSQTAFLSLPSPISSLWRECTEPSVESLQAACHRDLTVDQMTFDRIMKEKIYNFKSVLILSIFCPKNIVISKKIGLPFESVSDFCKMSTRLGAWHNAPLNNCLQCKKNENGSNRYLTKHNHDKRSTCCLHNNALRRDLVKTLILTWTKNYIKTKLSSY